MNGEQSMANVERPPLRIVGDMGIYRAEALRQSLLDALAADAVLELDLSEVTEFDAAGLQLLIMADRAARAAGGVLRVTACSEAVNAVLQLLQLPPSTWAMPDHQAVAQGER
jgi:anti-sigma B factor antagonist